MTFYKTVLYFVMDIVEGGKYTKHNSMKDQIQFVIIPSSFWLIVPAYILYVCLGLLKQVTVAAPRKPAKSKK
ncbi:hypothetical protein AGDE_04290 [Angomonas deanei]|uniref:Emopamil binding protein n=1 Tax=Angomonas deanei TaxID=59799 RepID=A0A7G2C6Q2_9TRYP|nr:hypothetical protein AGDE_04290 [Angomonas deanei]CAD2215508.1 hypothetical protein, conserved [Angomonas deanei]|eukprot:EPY39638.1 hypothetical protein AGDE_04290 [Angomonas deanei]